MKRFYELKCGGDSKRDYDAKERRGFVAPEFSFLKKGTTPKCILMQHNAEGSKKIQEEKPLEKKVKLSQNSGKAVKPQTPEQSQVESGSSMPLVGEREMLTERLTAIQQLVNCAKESDEALLRQVHEFIVSMGHQPPAQRPANDYFKMKQETDEANQDENDYFFRIPLKREDFSCD